MSPNLCIYPSWLRLHINVKKATLNNKVNPSVKFKLLLRKYFSVSCIHLEPNLDYLNPGDPLKQLLGNGILVAVEILVQLLTQENKGDTAAIQDCAHKLDFQNFVAYWIKSLFLSLRRWRFKCDLRFWRPNASSRQPSLIWRHLPVGSSITQKYSQWPSPLVHCLFNSLCSFKM